MLQIYIHFPNSAFFSYLSLVIKIQTVYLKALNNTLNTLTAMSSNIFLIIALVTTGIFVVQFILSVFFGDIDADADIDVDISSVVSFKGLTHFGIGFGWYMYLAGNTDVQSYLFAVLSGLVFVFAVWFLYKKAYQLQQVNHAEKTEQLVGRECTIYFKQSEGRYTVQISRDGAMREVDVISESDKSYLTGDKTIITAYKHGTLYIQ